MSEPHAHANDKLANDNLSPKDLAANDLAAGDLDRLVEQLQKEEGSAADATLSSVESLQMWVMSHPGLQQPGIYEIINQYGPAILQMIKKLIGL